MGEDVVMVWKNGQQKGDCKMAQSGFLAGYRLFLSLTHTLFHFTVDISIHNVNYCFEKCCFKNLQYRKGEPKDVFCRRGGKLQMSARQENFEDQKIKIISQTAELSRLLGMIPSDGTINIQEPMTQNSMVLSDWFSDTRDSFLRLSLLISKALDIQLQ
jgi:hypothetical protein